jgi:ankyrin repeat protein
MRLAYRQTALMRLLDGTPIEAVRDLLDAGSTDAVRLLLQAGADHTLRDAEGHTALWHARDNESDEAAALLLAYGAYDEPEREP